MSKIIEGKNIRVVEDFTLPLDGTVLLTGINGAGKSSILRALAFAVSGTKLSKLAAQSLVRYGATQGVIGISEHGSSNFDVSLDLPSGEITTTGEISASVYSAGLMRFCDAKGEVKTKFIQELLKSDLTEEVFTAAACKDGLKAEEVSAVWTTVQRKDWDGALLHYKERGKELKAQWHQIAGEAYGEKKAATWMPKDYESDLEGKSQETLAAELTQQRETLEELIKYEAVSDDEIGKLREEFQGLDVLTDTRDQLRGQVAAAQQKFNALNNEFKKLERPAKQLETHTCPHCDQAVVIQADKLIKPPTKQTEAQVKAMMAAIKAKQEEIDAAATQLNLLQTQEMSASLAVSNANRAGVKLQELLKKAAPAGKTPPGEAAIERQRQQVERAQARLAAHKLKQQADAKHADVARNQKIIDLLDPEGIRQKYSGDAVRRLNDEYLKPQCEIAGWPEVKIDKNMNISHGGTAYDGLSDGEKYRCNACIQIALGRLQNTSLFIFDRLEEVDLLPGLRGLFTLLKSVGIPALCAMKTDKRELAIDLAARGLGQTYWLDRGVVEPLKVGAKV